MTARRPLLVLLASLVLGACGDDAGRAGGEAGRAGGEELVQADPATGHVHAIGVDPADGAVVVAAHSGLFRAGRGDDRARRLGNDRRDVMGFTVEGPRRYAGSGHPDVRAGGPSSVGFIRSSDAGRTWQTVSLRGEADLHVLEMAPGRVYAYDAISGRFLASEDGGRSWRRTALPPVLDLAVDPDDPDRIVASAEAGLLGTTDGGRRWRPVGDAPASHLVWTRDGLVLLGYDGVVRSAPAPGEEMRTVGQLPVTPSAATHSGGSLLVAAHDGSVHASSDGGRTWSRRLQAAVD